MIVVLLNLLDLYGYIVLASVIGSWIDPYRKMEIFNMIRKVTEPFLNIFRVVIPLGNGRIDISPIIALWILNMIKKILIRFIYV